MFLCVCHRKHLRHDHALVTGTNKYRPEVSQIGGVPNERERESGPCMVKRQRQYNRPLQHQVNSINQVTELMTPTCFWKNCTVPNTSSPYTQRGFLSMKLLVYLAVSFIALLSYDNHCRTIMSKQPTKMPQIKTSRKKISQI